MLFPPFSDWENLHLNTMGLEGKILYPQNYHANMHYHWFSINPLFPHLAIIWTQELMGSLPKKKKQLKFAKLMEQRVKEEVEEAKTMEKNIERDLKVSLNSYFFSLIEVCFPGWCYFLMMALLAYHQWIGGPLVPRSYFHTMWTRDYEFQTISPSQYRYKQTVSLASGR